MMPSLAQRGRNSGASHTPARTSIALAGRSDTGTVPFTLGAIQPEP